MGYSITTPTYKSHIKSSVNSQIADDFLKDKPYPIITGICLINFIDDHFGIPFQPCLRKPILHTSVDRFMENEELDYHRVININKLHPFCHKDHPFLVLDNHSPRRVDTYLVASSHMQITELGFPLPKYLVCGMNDCTTQLTGKLIHS
ncbi:unnamed protein product [Linum trigynum]|uniref:Uncharacterized protein n=1 Tax=Linum trigynum TaxID=586398 RepID=A0AAV2ETZ9_9ROSI